MDYEMDGKYGEDLKAYEIDGVKYEEDYIMNIRDMKLFTCKWTPINEEPKALIFLCHGYAMECSISMKGVGTRLAKAGFGVYGMDSEGHGKSEGLLGYIPCFENLVKDVSDYYTSICGKRENVNKLKIVMGESMGGATALRLHRLQPDFWDGAIMIAPMCKLADDMKPSPFVNTALTKLCDIVPKWRIVPTQDIIDAAFRDPKVRKAIRANPYCYKGNLRVRTAKQLMLTTSDLEKNITEVKFPFLVLHGEDDTVIDPSASSLLYEGASSTYKTIKIYPGMWHSLSYGEFPENINIVFADILAWLNDRIALGNTYFEMEKKEKHDYCIKGSSS